ncbi:hypothetical protein K7472_30275 [Streptomyces sp. PTM05]|uniref:Uncharacterized protein n=1 Tax=Streptantibioticus parmotrematis TaxID=2873249 RepID=A0ABS7R0W1_9ACTN|nr:hypothetical protein [Streptantibioticus parmotrematis]MBY8889100.1 hypothetical protein [Streptantibioticus parmotrematis]
MTGRPLTRVERKQFNRAQHEQKIRTEMVTAHGEELGMFYYWLRLMNIRGTQAFRSGELGFIRDVALALENVYRRHN